MTTLPVSALLRGSKGGKGGSASTGAKEAPNTLQSIAIARILDLISEGPIKGLVGGDKGVYFDQTPYQAQSGTYNFNGADVDWRLGTPSQDVIPGFEASSTISSVGVEVKHMGDPYANAIIRRISDLTVTSARVTVTVEALYKQDTKTGDLNGHSVAFAIDVKQNADAPGASYVEKVYKYLPGKTTSPYPITFKIALDGVGPWDIRVRRVSTDDANSAEKSKTFWSILGSVKDYKLNYPNSALVGSMIDSSVFGNQLPARSYLIEGLLVQIPSNYDPVTRLYSGVWNGTFTTAYTNNPAWVLYDLVSNPHYGLGDVFSALRIEKWDLYAIAQYCDGWNARSSNPNNDYGANGKHGVSDGVGGFEPRFTFNGLINTSEKAYEALTALAGMFRSSVLWSGGKLRFIQDTPGTAVKVFGPANVVDGRFNYAGTALRARHTVAKVTWVNPAKNYEADVVLIEDLEGIERYGYNVLDLTAYGCTSYGQAVRHGKYALVTERLETDSVQFQIGIGEADILPGSIIKVSDPNMTTAEWAGRMVSCTTNTFRFDRPLAFNAARTYTLNVITASGALVQKGIVNPGTTSTDLVTLTSNFGADLPVTNAMWAVESDVLTARTFRLMSLAEDGPELYKVFAVEHSPTKFDEIEFDVVVPEPAWTDLPTRTLCEPPEDLELFYGIQGFPGGAQTVLDIDWLPSPDPYARGYVVGYQFGTDNWEVLPEQQTLHAQILSPRTTVVRVVVAAVNQYGIASIPIGADVDLNTATAVAKTPISQLYVMGTTGTAWSGRDLFISWYSTSLYGGGTLLVDGSDPLFKRFRVRLKDAATNTVLKTYYATKPLFTVPFEDMVAVGLARSYKVSVAFEDINGNLSTETTATFSNAAPTLATHLVNITPYAVTLKFAQNTDPDFVGTVVWMSTTNGFTPGSGNKIWEGPGNPVLPVTPLTTYYYRFAQYDAFGQTGMTTSAQYTAAVPAVSSADTTYADGTPVESLKARIVAGLDSSGNLISGLWGGAASIPVGDLIESSLSGKSLSLDSDFAKGTLAANVSVYDNSGGGKATLSFVTDAAAPNGTGRVLRISYDGTGTPHSNPTPGYGGVIQLLQSAGSGLSRPGYYSPNSKIAFVIKAKIPVGRTIEQASNTTGAGGGWNWITPVAGTGDWFTYIGIRTIGATGTFSSCGHIYVQNGANSAFTWDIARYDQIELSSEALPQLNRLIDNTGTIRTDAELITLLGTSASILGQGPGATASANDVLNYIDGTISTVRAPSGGQFTYDNSITGVIKISLPLGFSNTMVQFRVSVFDYQAGASVTYVVSGYTYSATSGTDGYWVNCSAQYIGPEGYARRVRFGFDGTKCCVWIGETSTVWQYPKVTINDVMLGYQNTTAANWKSGWSIAINTTSPNNNSPTYFGIISEVAKPRPGDAVFGEGIYETSGGAAASLANFKTQLGTAAAIISQGALATLNQVANAQIANSAITAIKFLVDSGVDLASIVPGSLNWRLSSSSSTDYSGGGWNGSGYNPAIDSGVIGITGAVNASTGHRCTMKVDLTVTQTAPTGGSFDGYIEAYYRINGGSWVATGYKKRSGSTVSQWSGNDTFNVPSAGTIEFGYRLTSTGPNSGSLGNVNIVDHSLTVEGIFWK